MPRWLWLLLTARRDDLDVTRSLFAKTSKTDPSSSFEHSIIAKAINLVLMRVTTESQNIQFESQLRFLSNCLP
eukprot:g80396.t1